MNQMLKSLVDRLEALPLEEQERVAHDLNQRLTEIGVDGDDATKLAALKRDIQVGLDQLDRGEGIPADKVFAELNS